MTRRRKFEPAVQPRQTRIPTPANELAQPQARRNLHELLAVVEPILDACRDESGQVDWQRVAATARSEVDAIDAGLVESMATYDAFDIIANMLLYNLPVSAETYRETEHPGQIANVE